MKTLISLASRTPDGVIGANRIVGGPDWLETAHFAISAALALDGPTAPATWSQRLPPLVRSLLEDRFKLATRIETREFPIYALVIARSDKRLGPKIHASPLTAADCRARLQHPDPFLQPPHCGLQNRGTGWTATAVPLSTVMSFLGPVDRLVLDRTGLDGLFDAEFQREEGVSVFASVQEQLGLKLEPRREPLDVIVVDHVEQPTPD